MSRGQAMSPEDQELFGRLGQALTPDAPALAVGAAAMAPLPGLRTAVLARNWRWVPLLAQLSWLLAAITGGTVAAVAAVAVTLTLAPPSSHHHPPTTPSTIPGSTQVAPGQPGGGSSSGSGPGSPAGSGRGSGPGATGAAAAGGAFSATGLPIGEAAHGITIVNPGDQTSVWNQAIAPLSNKAKGGDEPYTWSASGLPSGLSIDIHNGTITGTPTVTCSCSVTVNVVDSTRHQGSTSFTWTVTVPPAITSSDSATFTVGEAGTVTVTSNGVPTPSISETGPLPNGVTFSDQGDGTATLSGIPGEGTGGTYPITLEASNGPGSGATQSFTLTVDGGPTASLVLSPAIATIASGASQTYRASGLDVFGTSTGDVTALTTFTIAPSGGDASSLGAFCAGSSCTAESPGTYTVTGADGTATGTASLTVDPPPWPGPAASGIPPARAEGPNGYYIGVTADSWSFLVTHPSSAKAVYSGTITINGGDFSGVAPVKLEPADVLSSNGGTITFAFTNHGLLDGAVFTTPPDATSITFNLSINGTPVSAGQIYLGLRELHPSSAYPLTFFR